jgi:hypothetical protein
VLFTAGTAVALGQSASRVVDENREVAVGAELLL